MAGVEIIIMRKYCDCILLCYVESGMFLVGLGDAEVASNAMQAAAEKSSLMNGAARHAWCWW